MPNFDINQLATNDFGISASGYIGSQGPTGYLGSLGVNGSAGAAGSGSNKPKISNIQVTDGSYTVLDDTAVSVAGGYIKITGSGFVSGCNVLINQTTAVSVTFVSATEVRAQVPAMTAGGYIVYLVNTDGGTALSVTGIQYSGTPAWTTAAGTLGSPGNQVSFTANVVATGDAPVTYSVYSGALPGGLALTANTGVISGTTPNVASNTTYNFTIRATDAQLQDTDRAFSITVLPLVAPATVEYLVVAGGGGGATDNYNNTRGAGGGGAGGYLTGTTSVSASTTYTVTVGAGGAGSLNVDTLAGVSGSTGGNSVFSSITSYGGGKGGGHTSSTGSPASSGSLGGTGGSGGGGTNGAASTAGTAGQGNASGVGADFPFNGGGGGGAGGAGSGMNGGAAAISAISGTSASYAGGGGAWGVGGYGTAGTNAGSNGGSAVANFGGGGGGIRTAPGGSGGSGVVILRYSNTYATATATTGSPTVTVAGGYIVYKWTASGSITF